MQLRFIKLREKHLKQVRLWRMKPEVSKYMCTNPRISPQKQRQWYKQISKDPSQKHWIVEVNGNNVGLIRLYAIDLTNKHAYCGYYIGEPSAWGRNIGKAMMFNILRYAFDKIKLHKVYYEVLSLNERGLSLPKKFGVKIEGILKDHIYKEGKFYDIITMGILNSDWQKIKHQFQIEIFFIED